jgi:hypothetical protein
MKYFTLEELCATKTGITNIPSWQAVENLKALVNNVLDPIREDWGKPIIVTSGFRCKAVNDKVGGVATSQHTKGQAADLDIGTTEQNKELFDFICKSGITFDQLLLENNGAWVHLSYNINKNRQQILYINDKK